jgi:hypothetical protein
MNMIPNEPQEESSQKRLKENTLDGPIDAGYGYKERTGYNYPFAVCPFFPDPKS